MPLVLVAERREPSGESDFSSGTARAVRRIARNPSGAGQLALLR